MVLFKITSETSAETDVNCPDSQTLFASVEVGSVSVCTCDLCYECLAQCDPRKPSSLHLH